MSRKSSEFAARAVHEWTAQVFQEVDGPLLSGQYRLMIRTEREKAQEARRAEMLKKFDKDGDGKLSPEERKAMPKPPRRPGKPGGRRGPHGPGPGPDGPPPAPEE